MAQREGQNTRAVYRVHRWFARRLSSQFRAILTGLTLRSDEAEHFWSQYFGELQLGGTVVLDPFVGGGTAVSEAKRCGARVIGFDIDPVAASIARFGLSVGSYSKALDHAVELTEAVADQIAPYHRTTVDESEATVLHHFWVEILNCPSCEYTIELHPHYQLAYDREKKLQWVFCHACYAVHQLPIARKMFRCPCGEKTWIHRGPYKSGSATCPACSRHAPIIASRDPGVAPKWRLFAQEYIEGKRSRPARHFRGTTEEDRQLYRNAARVLQEQEVLAPSRPIPPKHRWDQRPLIHNITTYRQLFNDRQLLHLTLLGSTIRGVEDQAIRRVLSMAFTEHLTTNCMYTGYAFGYRRTSALFAIHSYRHIVRPVELNPWLRGIGRGTFPNALRKIRQAVQYAKHPKDIHPKKGVHVSTQSYGDADPVGSDALAVIEGKAVSAIRVEDSRKLRKLPANSVDLVLTDPPYFDNLSYSELSDFYLAWQQTIGMAEEPYSKPQTVAPISKSLALTSRRPEAVERYERLLTTIFKQCHRVLRPEGLCVFTFHHESIKAWLAMVHAIARSGFRCTAVVPMRGEGQGGLHSKEGTIKWDAVLVCRAGSQPTESSSLWVSRQDIEDTKKQCARMAKVLKDATFRQPDKINYSRALLARSCKTDCAHEDAVDLYEAMKDLRDDMRS